MAIIIKNYPKIPLVLIGRGEEYAYLKRKMPVFKRLAFGMTYALADHVIYKEPYMKAMFDKFKNLNYDMLSNSVDILDQSNAFNPDKCYFLFLNSIRMVRYPEIALKAFLQICEELNLNSQSPIRLYIVGFLGKNASKAEQKKEAELRSLIKGRDVPIELHAWTDTPEKWFDQADVFLLPADVVYLNYSLLEAMARGIPAIVQQSSGADHIIYHEKDGFILPKDIILWKNCMMRLIAQPKLKKNCGRAAREKLIEKFSLKTYLDTYHKIYQKILIKHKEL